MSVTVEFSTGRVVTRDDAADTQYDGATLKLVTKDGKDLCLRRCRNRVNHYLTHYRTPIA